MLGAGKWKTLADVALKREKKASKLTVTTMGTGPDGWLKYHLIQKESRHEVMSPSFLN